MISYAEIVEPVFGEFGIHDALEDLGAVDRALGEAIIAPEFTLSPELEDVPGGWIKGNLIVP